MKQVTVYDSLEEVFRFAGTNLTDYYLRVELPHADDEDACQSQVHVELLPDRKKVGKKFKAEHAFDEWIPCLEFIRICLGSLPITTRMEP